MEINLGKIIVEDEFNLGGIELDVIKDTPPLEDLEITPTKEKQVFMHENSYGYDVVTVEPINLQDKEISIKENGTHEVIADAEYDGLNKVSVTVDAIENLTDELTTYSNELTEQEITIEDIIGALKDKGIGEAPKYAPRKISFYQYSGTELTEELENLDISNIKDMSNMFYGCSSLTSLDVSNFDTSNVINMNSMFSNCSKLISLDVSNFDTSNVINMSSMFSSCSKLISLDVSNFDTSSVNYMSSMFSSCSSLTSLDVSNFDTSNIKDMYGMFSGCSNLTSLDLRNFDTSNLTNMNIMFYNCSKLISLDLRSFDFTKVNPISNIFYGVPTDCEIIVKDDVAKEWILTARSDFTNVKTVEELEVS